MKYNVFVFGTGSFAKRTLDKTGGGWDQVYHELNIIGYLDNNPHKHGLKFRDKLIHNPEILYREKFDMIIILSVYEDDIRKQLEDVYQIEPTNIYNLSEFVTMWCHTSESSALNKNVILWDNLWDGWRDFLPYYRLWFHPIAYCKNANSYNEDKEHFMNALPVISLKKVLESRQEYYFLIPEKDKEVAQQELLQSGVDKQHTIFLTEDYIYRTIYNDCCSLALSQGTKNPNLVFYVILYPWPRTGFCGALVYFLSHIIYAQQNGWIPIVDAKSIPNQYLKEGKLGIDNSWEYYFLPLNPYSLEEVYQSRNIIIAETKLSVPLNLRDPGSVNLYHSVWNQVQLQPETEKLILDAKERLLQKESFYVGVLFRGTDYANKKPHGSPKQPTLQQLLDKVKLSMDEWGCERVFLCTEVEEAISTFENEFPGKVDYVEQARFPENTAEWLYLSTSIKKQGQGHEIGMQYFIAITLLSQCDCLVAGNTSGVQTAIVMNNDNYRNKFIFDLGYYGLS